LPVVDDAEV